MTYTACTHAGEQECLNWVILKLCVEWDVPDGDSDHVGMCNISPLGSSTSNQSISLDCNLCIESCPGLGPFGSVRSLWAVVGGPWIRKTERGDRHDLGPHSSD